MICKEMRQWSNTIYDMYSMKSHYIKIPCRTEAESYLRDMSTSTDCKVHCLNGVIQYILPATNWGGAEGDKR